MNLPIPIDLDSIQPIGDDADEDEVTEDAASALTHTWKRSFMIVEMKRGQIIDRQCFSEVI